MKADIEVDRNTEIVKGLRELADFIESKPQMPHLQYASACSFLNSDLDAFKDAASSLGTFDKKYDDYDLRISREFSGGVVLYFSIRRETLGCKKIISWDCPDKSLMRQLGLESTDGE